MGSRLHVGIFGPGDSGKTTLAQHLSREFWRGGIKSLVLDPNEEKGWGIQSFVTADEDVFTRVFWREKRCACFIEEATETIKRDSEKSSLFTRGRHRGHKIIVVGHSGSSLLPVHRLQLHTLFLFRQPERAAEIWADQFADMRILRCATLNQHEFLHCELFKEPVVRKLRVK